MCSSSPLHLNWTAPTRRGSILVPSALPTILDRAHSIPAFCCRPGGPRRWRRAAGAGRVAAGAVVRHLAAGRRPDDRGLRHQRAGDDGLGRRGARRAHRAGHGQCGRQQRLQRALHPRPGRGHHAAVGAPAGDPPGSADPDRLGGPAAGAQPGRRHRRVRRRAADRPAGGLHGLPDRAVTRASARPDAPDARDGRRPAAGHRIARVADRDAARRAWPCWSAARRPWWRRPSPLRACSASARSSSA